MKHFFSYINESTFQGVHCSAAMVLPYRVAHNSKLYHFAVIIGITNAFIALGTILANSMVIIAICRCKKLLQKMFYKGLIFMAITDFCTGKYSEYSSMGQRFDCKLRLTL